MKTHWFQIIKDHASVELREEGASYENKRLTIASQRLYFVVEGCVIVRSKIDHHVLYLVRSRGCLNIEELISEQYDYEYIGVKDVRLLNISTQRMHQLLMQYPKLMPRLLRHEHHILDQMILFAKLYRRGCQEDEMKALYDRLRPPFSYAVFQNHVRNDIIVSGVDRHDNERQ